MARKIDPAVDAILKSHGLNAKDVLWDCHGTWCMYHRELEQVAAKAGITFEKPALLENNGAQKSVAICVTGHMGDRMEWSIGEAAPGNNKNAYPYAMAEKRGKDRVILKLIGLHGLVYSEEEIDEAPPKEAPLDNAALDSTATATELIRELRDFRSIDGLKLWGVSPDVQARIDSCTEADKARVRGDFAKQLKTLKEAEYLAA